SSSGCCAASGPAATDATMNAATIVALIDRSPTSFEPEVLLDLPALIHVAVVAVRVARLALDQLAIGSAALRAARADERRRVERVVHGQRTVHRQTVLRDRPALDDPRRIAARHRVAGAVEPAGHELRRLDDERAALPAAGRETHR